MPCGLKQSLWTAQSELDSDWAPNGAKPGGTLARRRLSVSVGTRAFVSFVSNKYFERTKGKMAAERGPSRVGDGDGNTPDGVVGREVDTDAEEERARKVDTRLSDALPS